MWVDDSHVGLNIDKPKVLFIPAANGHRLGTLLAVMIAAMAGRQTVDRAQSLAAPSHDTNSYLAEE